MKTIIKRMKKVEKKKKILVGLPLKFHRSDGA